jgi:hypothetical protein
MTESLPFGAMMPVFLHKNDSVMLYFGAWEERRGREDFSPLICKIAYPFPSRKNKTRSMNTIKCQLTKQKNIVFWQKFSQKNQTKTKLFAFVSFLVGKYDKMSTSTVHEIH